jgi:hypothetical protein
MRPSTDPSSAVAVGTPGSSVMPRHARTLARRALWFRAALAASIVLVALPASALGGAARYEIGGDLEGGPIRIVEHGELPSAGDTSYAGVVRLRGPRFLVSSYSSPPALDQNWIIGFGGRTDIWTATLDLPRLPRRPR